MGLTVTYNINNKDLLYSTGNNTQYFVITHKGDICRLVAQTVKNLPANAGNTSLSQEDPLEKEMATHYSILACEIPWTEEPGGVQSMESRNRRDLVTRTA